MISMHYLLNKRDNLYGFCMEIVASLVVELSIFRRIRRFLRNII